MYLDMQNLVGWFSATLVLLGLGVLVAAVVLKRTGIALRCYPGSLSHSRTPTLCRSIIQGRNPSWSRSPSHTRSPTGTRSP